jgi:hypothetical protein
MDWQDFFPDAAKPVPLTAPEPRGNDVIISCFVDADHAGNRITYRCLYWDYLVLQSGTHCIVFQKTEYC